MKGKAHGISSSATSSKHLPGHKSHNVGQHSHTMTKNTASIPSARPKREAAFPK